MGIQINGNTNNINAGIGSLSIEDINELDIVGVATAANFKTGVSNLHNVGLTLSGGQIDVGSNIKIGTAGVITATSFVGSGSGLTGLPAGTTINTNADNRVITGSGSANTLNADANLTFNNSTGQLVVGASGSGYISVRKPALAQVDIQHSTTNSYCRLYMSQSSGSGGYFAINKLGTVDAGYTGGVNAVQLWSSAAAPMIFATNNAEKLRITSGGKFGFGTDSPYTHGIATFNDSNGIVLEGSSQGRLLFRHTGGGTNLKMFDIQSSNGVMKFRTIADNGTTVTERLTITAAGTVTASGTFESTGTGAGVGGKFGQISVGAGGVYNTIQNTVANTPIHLQYSNTGNIKCNEGGGDMQTRDIFPETNNSYSLGTDAKRWANIHTNDLNLSNEGSTNDVDGTWGQYTIQEGENDLFLINKRNGKRYKFNLTEVD